MKLGRRQNYHKGWAIRHYANHPARPICLLRRRPNFTSAYRGVNARLAFCHSSVLNVKALLGAFNQEKLRDCTTSPIYRLQHYTEYLYIIHSLQMDLFCHQSMIIIQIQCNVLVTSSKLYIIYNNNNKLTKMGSGANVLWVLG